MSWESWKLDWGALRCRAVNVLERRNRVVVVPQDWKDHLVQCTTTTLQASRMKHETLLHQQHYSHINVAFRCIYTSHLTLNSMAPKKGYGMWYVTSYLHITTWEISKACNQCEKWSTIMTSTFQMWRRLGRSVSVPFQSGLSSSFPSRHQDDKRGATALGSPTQSSPAQQPSRAEKEPTNQNQPLTRPPRCHFSDLQIR